MPTREQVDAAITILEDSCARYGISDAFFVGGFPRAMAMGRGLSDVKDLDVASGTIDKATQLAGLAAEAADAGDSEVVHHRTGTITLRLGEVEVDFQGPMEHEHVRPFLHYWGVDDTPVNMNVFDRDFTMNSLAMPIGGYEIVDVTQRGMDDIEDGKVASILPPSYSVPRNPLMITRAVKFAYKYDFKIDGALWSSMKENSGALIKKLSPERLAIESFVLSKHGCGDMLEDLGIGYLRGPDMRDEGKRITEKQDERLNHGKQEA